MNAVFSVGAKSFIELPDLDSKNPQGVIEKTSAAALGPFEHHRNSSLAVSVDSSMKDSVTVVRSDTEINESERSVVEFPDEEPNSPPPELDSNN